MHPVSSERPDAAIASVVCAMPMRPAGRSTRGLRPRRAGALGEGVPRHSGGVEAAPLDFSGNITGTANYTIIVASTIKFSGASVINANFSSLPDGNLIKKIAPRRMRVGNGRMTRHAPGRSRTSH